jgi:hypothetical protein
MRFGKEKWLTYEREIDRDQILKQKFVYGLETKFRKFCKSTSS